MIIFSLPPTSTIPKNEQQTYCLETIDSANMRKFQDPNSHSLPCGCHKSMLPKIEITKIAKLLRITRPKKIYVILVKNDVAETL